MPPDQDVFRRWWPTTQSLDLIEGPIRSVADAAAAEFAKIADYVGDNHSAAWRSFEELDAAFASVPYFDNVGSQLLLLPTHSKWVVMWNNSFLCSGFDRFCLALTSHHALNTIHWSAHDDWTTFQSGALFHFRRMGPDGLVQRLVQTAQTDRRWDFFERGNPLPEEDLAGYGARRKRDRLNERRLIELLARFGAEPWNEAFYALPEREAFILSRPLPEKAIRRSRDDVIARHCLPGPVRPGPMR